MTAKIMHLPSPGPDYWSWRCLRCSGSVEDHASVWQIIWARLTIKKES